MPTYDSYYSNRTEAGSCYTVQYCIDWFNKRLRVDDYEGNALAMLRWVADLAKQHTLTKLFIKTREQDWQQLLSRGCMLEGVYQGYFNGDDAYCMALYFDPERRTSDYWMEEDGILSQVLELPPISERKRALPQNLALRLATAEDAVPLAALYSQVFRTYPTPMNDPGYIEHVMQSGTIFYAVTDSGSGTDGAGSNTIISAASAEMNAIFRNAEITDCATLPAYRSLGLMRLLVHALEKELSARNIGCMYSLSRALSFGMNAVFFQLGYRYCGRLTKNCDIYDKFEDMNLWVKHSAPNELT